jgi:hypothetical protein
MMKSLRLTTWLGDHEARIGDVDGDGDIDKGRNTESICAHDPGGIQA